jgi:hypothetical protein
MGRVLVGVLVVVGLAAFAANSAGGQPTDPVADGGLTPGEGK